MCLLNSKENTAKFLTKNKRRKTVTAYKVVFESDGQLYSLFHNKRYAPGQIISNTERTQTSRFCQKITRGIHVFLDHQYAIYDKQMWNGYAGRAYKVLKVECKLSDLIGVDIHNNEAVFTQVNVTKAAYRKAFSNV